MGQIEQPVQHTVSKQEDWIQQATHWEYSAAAKPDLGEIPIAFFPAALHASGPTRVIALDQSQDLQMTVPATTPALLANYLRIQAGESLSSTAAASSEVFYVMYGHGHSDTPFGRITWRQGDAFTLPVHQHSTHHAASDAALVWAHDAPLLSYLGAVPQQPRFRPAFYPADGMQQTVADLREAGIAEGRNRNGIILGNQDCLATKTITHSMWSLYNLLPAGSVQKPHRHQSVAVDLALQAASGTYTLIGKDIDANGQIIDPIKAPWTPNSIFTTPPGWWHAHHNESDEDAYVFPIQDAGLHTHLRTLDIQFVR